MGVSKIGVHTQNEWNTQIKMDDFGGFTIIFGNTQMGWLNHQLANVLGSKLPLFPYNRG